MTEAIIHGVIVVIFIMEVVQHWTHHRRNKHKRKEKLYTLDEAKAVLWDTYVAKPSPILFDKKDAAAKEVSRMMDIWG